MNVRPIDLQILIPQSTEIAKAQHISNQQTAIKQQLFAEQWQQLSAERQQQIQSLPKTEGGKVNERPQYRERQNGHKQNTKRQAESLETCHDENIANDDPVLGHLIDIKT